MNPPKAKDVDTWLNISDNRMAYMAGDLRPPLTPLVYNDTDVDGDTLALTDLDAASPQGATVSRDGAYVVYAAPPGFEGIDTFRYAVGDGRDGVGIGTVTVWAFIASDLPSTM